MPDAAAPYSTPFLSRREAAFLSGIINCGEQVGHIISLH